MLKSALALFASLGLLIPGIAQAELKVVATVPDLAALAQELGGQHVSVVALSLSTQDPHFVDARPSLALELNKADLLLAVGLQLEVGWLPVLLTGARNGAIQTGSRGYLDCSQFPRLLQIPLQPIDRSMGDIHPGGNPHYMKDPRAAAEVAKGISARLAELDPENAAFYKAKLQAFLDRLAAARKRWEKAMAPHRGAPVIGYHQTWVYVADWLGLTEVELLEPKPGIPPNPTHVANVLRLGRARKVRLILQEEFYPDTTSKLVAEKLGATLVKVPGGTRFQKGQSYVEHIDETLGLIQRALEPGKEG
jgi:zinc/manganese transport system substrate-binding protein